MKKNYTDSHIEILNNENFVICTVEDNENMVNFLDNWYFLNTFQNNHQFDGLFDINYK